jgi:hypothetical protein
VKKLLGLTAAGALVLAVPAFAAKPPHPTHPTHPTHPSHPSHGKGHSTAKGKALGHTKTHTKGGKSCTAHNRGYNAKGTLVSAALTPAGGKDRYDGSLTVDVTRANHGAPTGSQTFTLSDARVRFGKGLDSSSVSSGDRVALHGKITALPHRCDSTGFTPTTVVRNVRIRAPRT